MLLDPRQYWEAGKRVQVRRLLRSTYAENDVLVCRSSTMLASALLAALTFASSALGLPQSEPAQAQESDRCQTYVGWNAFANAGPFTLSAVNKTLGIPTRALELGEPLHLSPSVAHSGSEYRSLATNETYPYAEFSQYSLIDGGLIATNNFSTGAGAAASDIGEGYTISFEVSHDQLSPDPVFCAVVGTSPAGGNPIYPLLALHGDTLNFALCEAASEQDDIPLNVVVYKPRWDSREHYDYDSCYGVYVQLVPVPAPAGES
ncbi:hypothetical protein BV20DRAFT_227912 [Pilatotrama ljubarskyi]|nr:hypothetical protein BV20DRAFT_227912 [Pilatotrama ljubarskyi]